MYPKLGYMCIMSREEFPNTYPSPKAGAVLPVLRVTIHYIK